MKRIFLICLALIGMTVLNGCSTLYAVADTIESVCYSVENIEYNINRTKRSFEQLGKSFNGSRRCSFDDMEQTIPQDSLYYLEFEPVYFPE